jgi:hypothetical protein
MKRAHINYLRIIHTVFVFFATVILYANMTIVHPNVLYVKNNKKTITYKNYKIILDKKLPTGMHVSLVLTPHTTGTTTEATDKATFLSLQKSCYKAKHGEEEEFTAITKPLILDSKDATIEGDPDYGPFATANVYVSAFNDNSGILFPYYEPTQVMPWILGYSHQSVNSFSRSNGPIGDGSVLVYNGNDWNSWNNSNLKPASWSSMPVVVGKDKKEKMVTMTAEAPPVLPDNAIPFIATFRFSYE